MSGANRWQERDYFLDRHVAPLFGLKTRSLNRRIRDNHNRFRDGFASTLTREEFAEYRLQNDWDLQRGGTRHPPTLISSEGLLMLQGLWRNHPAASGFPNFGRLLTAIAGNHRAGSRARVPARINELSVSLFGGQSGRESIPWSGRYCIGGVWADIDKEAAAALGLDTRSLNQLVSRHANEFTPDMVFSLRAQDFVAFKKEHGHFRAHARKSNPVFYTRKGILMASFIANTTQAIQISRTAVRELNLYLLEAQRLREIQKRDGKAQNSHETGSQSEESA